MKKIFAILFSLTLLVSIACAEDYSSFTIEELLKKRADLLAELSQVTKVYGEKVKNREENTAASDMNLGSIESLFPDEQLAMFVWDRLNKFSISQPVTQAELDTIKEARFGDLGSGFSPVDFTGISYLRNLQTFSIRGRHDIMDFPEEVCLLERLEILTIESTDIVSLPESIENLKSLKEFYATYSDLKELPDSFVNLPSLSRLQMCYIPMNYLPEDFGKLISLEYIDIKNSSVKTLPESICDLTSLKTLIIAKTDIRELPDNIGNLISLETLDISDTKISSLPDSIWGLTIKHLDMRGTTIK